jgi:hypothetical protein
MPAGYISQNGSEFLPSGPAAVNAQFIVSRVMQWFFAQISSRRKIAFEIIMMISSLNSVFILLKNPTFLGKRAIYI